MSPTETLAAHLAGISAATVPAAVRDAAGLVLADTLGSIIAGQSDAAVAATARRRATGGLCRLPGIHAVAAALAEAEVRNAGGAPLLDAVLAGYEAGARVGMATRLRPTAHPHGTWGTLGAAAAAAVARLRGHDPAIMRRVLEVAASLGLATSATAALRGGSVRTAYAGRAAQNGMLACDLAEVGVTGKPEGIAAVFGCVVGEAFDENAMLEGLGERWLAAQAFFKQASCCRETQGTLEALELLLAEAPVAPAAPIAGRFSIPFTVAARVDVREAPALTAGGAGTPGDPDRPLPEDALREKFRRCAGPALGPRWDAARRAARHPDGSTDLSALF